MSNALRWWYSCEQWIFLGMVVALGEFYQILHLQQHQSTGGVLQWKKKNQDSQSYGDAEMLKCVSEAATGGVL